MSRSATEYLRHILDEVHYVVEHSQELSKESFLLDETKKRAFVRSLEIIGEATKKLPEDFRSVQDHSEWRSIAGMRDRLIHDYFGVDYEIVWDVITSKLPEFRDEIEKLLSEADS